jgi:pimeloyl-ACP methyl ester carboxylesterase
LDAEPAKQKATAKREAAAKEKEKGKQPVARNGNYNVATPTAGGIHYWGDELCYFDWRIQRHALTGHCRLIDGANINTRHAWGTFEECERELERIRERDELPAMSGRAVIVLHGLGGFTAVMAPLADRLREGDDCQVFNLAYPSMHGDMASHARGLASVIEHLDGIERIDLVGHSMGNVVLRYYLGEAERSSEGHDPRLERVVMLAPPNRQSERAAWWGEIRLVSDLLGKSFRQLGADWPEIADKLGVPPGEFGIIAGGKQNDRGFAFTLEGDDDGVLSVESTRLEGATDFVVLPVRHEVMLIDKETHDCAARFLETGRFAAPEEAARDEPLVEEPKDEPTRE